MAFRPTGISPGVIFQTARGPGLALERGLDKVFAGITAHVELKRKLDDEARKEADAINIFRSAKDGDIANLFDTITDDANAGLAVNLANVLSTKNQIDAQAALRQAQAKKVAAEQESENTFFANHGSDLLGAVRENLMLSPEVSVNELVPKLDATGQPVMENGRPVFDTRSRVISESVQERNPLFDVVQKIRASGKPLTPQLVKMLLAENERVQKAALSSARERGLNSRAAESSARAGQRTVGRSALSSQGAAQDTGLEETRQEGRADLEELRQGNRMDVVKARAAAQLSAVDARLKGAKSVEELKLGVRKELASLERDLRKDLAEARSDETKARLLDSNDRVLVKMILRLRERKQASFGQIAPGLSLGEAYWQTLGGLSAEAVSSFAIRRKDESAIYTLIVKNLMDSDPAGAPPSDAKLEEVTKRVKDEHGITINPARFKKFLEEAQLGDI